MATFSRSGYGHAAYAAFRPSYPPSLYRTVLAYHHAPGAPPASPAGALLDLGCGHGVVARSLAPHFARVTAVDPSPGMVEQARRLTPAEAYPGVTVRPGRAEDLSFLADGSVDLAAAAQAAHWFDYGRAWPELARVVRPGGSVAFWGYKDNVLVGHPATAAVYLRYVYGRGEARAGSGTEAMGRFWEQPGREVLRGSLRAVAPPAAEWEAVRRVAWDPEPGAADAGRAGAPPEALWQARRMRLGEYEGYLRTFSAFSGWRAAHPGRRSRAEGGPGDVVDEMLDEMRAAAPAWEAAGAAWRDVEVESVWGTALLMAKRR